MTIRLPLKKLSHWQQCTFAAALLERMLPNYQMFSEALDFGDARQLRNQLDLVWQWLDKSQKVKVNAGAQIEKLAELVPDPELFDSFGVFPAIDAAMALTALLQAISDKELDNIESVGRLSENSVRYYIELLLAEEFDAEQEPSAGDRPLAEPDEQMLEQHPLFVWERDTQNELFDYLQAAPENKATIKQAKAMVLAEGMSNLGIEI